MNPLANNRGYQTTTWLTGFFLTSKILGATLNTADYIAGKSVTDGGDPGLWFMRRTNSNSGSGNICSNRSYE